MKRYNRLAFGVIISASLAFSIFMNSDAMADCEGSSGPPPMLSTFKSVDPTLIWLEGTGTPDEATVTLTVAASGYPSGDTDTIDVMLVMDKSGSMLGQKMADAKAAAVYFCTLLEFNADQSGLVSFSSTANLDQGLTPDHNNTIAAIQGLFAGGGTAMGSGISVAQVELTSTRHRYEAVPVMVLMSDGDHNQGPDPVTEADIAKSEGTTIYTIGLGPSANESLLRQVATEPDSEFYFYAPTSADLDSIYEKVHGHLSTIVASNTIAKEILAPNVHLVPNTFSVRPLSVYGDTAAWNLGELRFGDSWEVTFNITASDTGHLPVDAYPIARVDYINCMSADDSVPFPQAYIDVIAPLTGIEEELVRGERGLSMRIAPNPFSFTSTIQYSLNRASHVRLEVYNLMGEQVRTLVDGENGAGTHIVEWNRKDDLDREVSSGVYLLRLKAGDYTTTHKIVLLR
jgi:uncharacterized protein YegL